MFFNDLLLFLSVTLVVVSTAAVLMEKNIMRACLALLGSLFGVAGLYACLGADFLAAIQLVVYAGGVVILMLFAVMLTGGTEDRPNRFGIEKIPAMGNQKTYVIAFLSAAVVAMIVMKLFANIEKSQAVKELPAYESTVEQIGILLATDHILAFEISSILLLGALIGAAVIARPKRN